MRGLILDNKEYIHTDMNVYFKNEENLCADYNWLITDYECNYYPNAYIKNNSSNYLWFSQGTLNSELLDFNIQFIWGVFSAFDKSISLSQVLSYPLPKSKKCFFSNKRLEIQHPLAIMEIVAIDSTLSFMISKDEEILNNIKKRVKGSSDLQYYLNKL